MGQNKVANCSHLVVLAAQKVIDDSLVDRFIESVAQTRGQRVEELQPFSKHIKEVFADMSASQKREWAHQQAYIALGTLLTAAAALKIDTCPMSGFEPDGFDRVLGLQQLGLEASVICALGIRHPEDDYARSAKVRYRESDLVITV